MKRCLDDDSIIVTYVVKSFKTLFVDSTVLTNARAGDAFVYLVNQIRFEKKITTLNLPFFPLGYQKVPFIINNKVNRLSGCASL